MYLSKITHPDIVNRSKIFGLVTQLLNLGVRFEWQRFFNSRRNGQPLHILRQSSEVQTAQRIVDTEFETTKPTFVSEH